MMAKRLLCTPLTNRIMYGTVKDIGNGVLLQDGKREDLTEDCLAATFEWFMNNIKKNKKSSAYEIRYKGIPYVLRMEEENDKDNQEHNG